MSSACVLAWLCLGLLFMACGVRAQIVPSLPSTPVLPLVTSVPQPPSADPLKIELGERLFNDPHLSRNDERACSSCHEVGTNGASNRQFDTSIEGSKLPFNTQTIFNAALSFPRLDLDGNVQSLEQQVEASLNAPEIMGTSVSRALQSIKTEDGMVRQFTKIYGHGPDRDSLLDAISTYERSLLTPDSPFDHWLNGDAQSAVS
jgi:cytochrome c peroxidase